MYRLNPHQGNNFDSHLKNREALVSHSGDEVVGGESGIGRRAAAGVTGGVGMPGRKQPSGEIGEANPIKSESEGGEADMGTNGHRSVSLLRNSCDNCSRKKNKCSGDSPCNRCARSGVQCTYSTKRKLGRPRTATQRQGGTAKKPKGAMARLNIDRPSFSISPATGLAGLAESRYLSCFVEHFNPLYPVTNEVSIRDGLIYVVAGMSNGESLDTLQEPEAMKGRALSCSLYLSIAIGGLMLGCPETAIARHIAAAKATLDKFHGLSDRFAVSALVLYAMVVLILRNGKVDDEYRKYEGQAKAVYDSLLEKDPMISALFMYRTLFAGVQVLTMEQTYSANPINALLDTLNASSNVGARTPAGNVIVKHGSGATDPGGGTIRPTLQRFLSTQKSHPMYVVTDGLFLIMRFPNKDKHNAAATHVHDFLVAEIDRLTEAEAGALVLSSLGCALLVMKLRLGRRDVLPPAKLITTVLQKCPGIPRHHGGHTTHFALAVLRSHGYRTEYDTARMLLMQAVPSYVPTFDEYAPGISMCEMDLCSKQCDMFLELGIDSGRPNCGSSCTSDIAEAGSISTDSVNDHGMTSEDSFTKPETPRKGASLDAEVTPPSSLPDSQSQQSPELLVSVPLSHNPRGDALAATPNALGDVSVKAISSPILAQKVDPITEWQLGTICESNVATLAENMKRGRSSFAAKTAPALLASALVGDPSGNNLRKGSVGPSSGSGNETLMASTHRGNASGLAPRTPKDLIPISSPPAANGHRVNRGNGQQPEDAFGGRTMDFTCGSGDTWQPRCLTDGNVAQMSSTVLGGDALNRGSNKPPRSLHKWNGHASGGVSPGGGSQVQDSDGVGSGGCGGVSPHQSVLFRHQDHANGPQYPGPCGHPLGQVADIAVVPFGMGSGGPGGVKPEDGRREVIAGVNQKRESSTPLTGHSPSFQPRTSSTDGKSMWTLGTDAQQGGSLDTVPSIVLHSTSHSGQGHIQPQGTDVHPAASLPLVNIPDQHRAGAGVSYRDESQEHVRSLTWSTRPSSPNQDAGGSLDGNIINLGSTLPGTTTIAASSGGGQRLRGLATSSLVCPNPAENVWSMPRLGSPRLASMIDSASKQSDAAGPARGGFANVGVARQTEQGCLDFTSDLGMLLEVEDLPDNLWPQEAHNIS